MSGRTVAGEITLIATQRGYVDETRANRGDRVFARGYVRTDELGSLQFKLTNKIEQCTLVTSTRVDIQPSDTVLLHFDSGTAVCLTTSDPVIVQLNAGTNTELRLSDPGFLVTVDPNQTTIRVLTGLVEVRSTETGVAVLLGPKLRSDVFPGGGPTEPHSWGTGELEDDAVLDAVNQLRNLPGPDMSLPDPAGSPTLERIIKTGRITVGLAEVVAADAGSDRFVGRFFSNQIVNWEIAAHVRTVMSPETGFQALQTGQIDMFVSPGPIEGLGQIPLFDDRQGTRAWIHFDPADKLFGNAEQTYLRNQVIDGGYRVTYLDSFDAEPTYDAVASLFGLD